MNKRYKICGICKQAIECKASAKECMTFNTLRAGLDCWHKRCLIRFLCGRSREDAIKSVNKAFDGFMIDEITDKEKGLVSIEIACEESVRKREET